VRNSLIFWVGSFIYFIFHRFMRYMNFRRKRGIN
jgi:hypothetical protein